MKCDVVMGGERVFIKTKQLDRQKLCHPGTVLLKIFVCLFIHERQREREKQREKQAPKEQGARRGTRSQNPGIMT